MDYRMLNQAVTPTAAAIPDVAISFGQINTHPGTWHAAIDLANTSFSILSNKAQQKQFAF